MNIDGAMVDYVAALAKLRLNDEEKANMEKDLNNILGYMDVLNSLDTEGVEAVTHSLSMTNVFREDVVKESYDRDELLKNALEVENKCFKVPQTVE